MSALDLSPAEVLDDLSRVLDIEVTAAELLVARDYDERRVRPHVAVLHVAGQVPLVFDDVGQVLSERRRWRTLVVTLQHAPPPLTPRDRDYARSLLVRALVDGWREVDRLAEERRALRARQRWALRGRRMHRARTEAVA